MGGFAESATWTVMLNVPAAVAVPLIVPSPLSVSPAGRFPLASDHVMAAFRPSPLTRTSMQRRTEPVARSPW